MRAHSSPADATRQSWAGRWSRWRRRLREALRERGPLLRLGWWAGCVSAYPTHPFHKGRIVKWLTRFDPMEEPEP